MAAVTALMPGCAAAVYRNTGTFGSPTWTAQILIKDVKRSGGWVFPEASSRETPIKLYSKALLDLPYQVVMRADPAAQEYGDWLARHFSRTNVFDLMILNGLITVEGAKGIRGEFLLSLTDEGHEIEGMIYSTFELRPTLTANGYPTVVTMGASSTPAFTSITF